MRNETRPEPAVSPADNPEASRAAWEDFFERIARAAPDGRGE